MKKYAFAILGALLITTSCTTLSRSYGDWAADLLPSDGMIYMTIHPALLEKSTAETIALSVMPTLNKEQLSYIGRIDTLTVCTSGATNQKAVYGLMQGNLPSLRFLIGLDTSKSWKKQGNYWYNESAKLYLSEPGPGLYYFGSEPPVVKKAGPATREETERLIEEMLDASAAFAVKDMNAFLSGTFGMEDTDIPLERLVCKIVKTESTSDILYTFIFSDKDSARIYTPFCKTVIYVLSGLAYPPLKALKLIQQAEWTTDDKGALVCAHRGLTDLDISFILSRLTSLLGNPDYEF